MNLNKATKQQLLTILQENIPMDLQYEVCRILQKNQKRKWNDSMITPLVVMWAKGESVNQIATALRVNSGQIAVQIEKLDIGRVRFNAIRKFI
jgi:hypothetical protein